MRHVPNVAQEWPPNSAATNDVSLSVASVRHHEQKETILKAAKHTLEAEGPAVMQLRPGSNLHDSLPYCTNYFILKKREHKGVR